MGSRQALIGESSQVIQKAMGKTKLHLGLKGDKKDTKYNQKCYRKFTEIFHTLFRHHPNNSHLSLSLPEIKKLRKYFL